MDGKELNELRELVEFLKANEIAEFDMERSDLKVRIKFVGEPAPAAAGLDMAQLARLMAGQGGTQVPAITASAVPAPVASAPAAPAAAPAAVDPDAGAHIVKSPIVGTFYDAPSPGSEPF